jgi:exopolysaccharide biosynthesis polyprenyl glycosylphosphotransferase
VNKDLLDSKANDRRPIGRFALILSITIDCASIVAAYVWTANWVFIPDVSIAASIARHAPYGAIVLLVWCAASLDQQLSISSRNVGLSTYLYNAMRALLDGLIVSAVAMALSSPSGLQSSFLTWFGASSFVLLLAWRGAARLAVWYARERGYNLKRSVVIGSNDRARQMFEVMQSTHKHGHSPVGFIEDDPERAEPLASANIPWLGATKELDQILESESVDVVYICLPIRSSYEKVMTIVEMCEQHAIEVHMAADLFPLRIATNRLMYVEDIPLLSLSAVPEQQARLALKRTLDLLVSSILLVVFAPLYVAIALGIKMGSRGPVLFSQERVGQNQRRFNMYKFRSMVADAEALREDLEAQNEADGPVFKIRKDPRITKIGRFLLRSSLDELPQLLNVFVGQMSLVGPRPPLASEVAQYSWNQRRRLSVKPGMTGLWQVSGRSDVSFEQWVEMDLAYIDSWSLVQDFMILLQTFRVVVQGKGAA